LTRPQVGEFEVAAGAISVHAADFKTPELLLSEAKSAIKQVTVQELKQMMDKKEQVITTADLNTTAQHSRLPHACQYNETSIPVRQVGLMVATGVVADDPQHLAAIP